MDTLTTADLLPEFERLPGLVHRRHYAIARRPRGNDGHLQVTLTHPQYDAEADSWLFPDGHSRQRDSEDLWIPVDELPGAERRAWERHQLRTADESDARTRPTEPSTMNQANTAALHFAVSVFCVSLGICIYGPGADLVDTFLGVVSISGGVWNSYLFMRAALLFLRPASPIDTQAGPHSEAP